MELSASSLRLSQLRFPLLFVHWIPPFLILCNSFSISQMSLKIKVGKPRSHLR